MIFEPQTWEYYTFLKENSKPISLRNRRVNGTLIWFGEHTAKSGVQIADLLIVHCLITIIFVSQLSYVHSRNRIKSSPFSWRDGEVGGTKIFWKSRHLKHKKKAREKGIESSMQLCPLVCGIA